MIRFYAILIDHYLGRLSDPTLPDTIRPYFNETLATYQHQYAQLKKQLFVNLK